MNQVGATIGAHSGPGNNGVVLCWEMKDKLVFFVKIGFMVSLSCGKINDTVEPLLILQEIFMKLIKKSIYIHIYIYAERFRTDRISGKRLRGDQNIWISCSPMTCIPI